MTIVKRGLKTENGLKPTGMTPLVTGEEHRGLKPTPMTPVQPEHPTQAPAPPAQTPKK